MGENAASRHLSRTKNLKALMNLNETDETVGDFARLPELNAKQKWTTKILSLRMRWCDDCNGKTANAAYELIKAATAGIHFKYRQCTETDGAGGALSAALIYSSDAAGFQSKDLLVLQLKKIHGHTQR